MKSFLFKAVVLFAVLVVSGCSTTYKAYRGSGLSRNQIAVLEVPEQVKLVKVDRKLTTLFTTPMFRRVELLPGVHEIYVYLNIEPARGSYTLQGGAMSLKFKAEAGHTYCVNFQEGGGKWRAWVEDITEKEQNR